MTVDTQMTTLTNTLFSTGTLMSRETLPSTSGWQGETDMLLRMSKSPFESEYSVIAAMPTAHAQSEFATVFQYVRKANEDVKLLQDVVKWQHNLLDYNAHYSAFLLEQVTESEFEEVASSFVYEQEEVDPAFLSANVERVLNLTQIDYPPSELAEFFRCDPNQVVTAYRSLVPRYSNLAKMLPVTELPDQS